mgnify:CR=1 FL=1
MNLIIMGAPGAGKGTQAELIAARENIPAISTGQILRDAMKAGTELGNIAKSYVESGGLVPDEIVIGIVRDYLVSDACKNGFILDGFPRTIPQAAALEAMGVKIDVVLSLEVADEKIVERISRKHSIEKVEIAKALCQMLDEGYIYKAVVKDEKHGKVSILKPNWELLSRDKLWQA